MMLLYRLCKNHLENFLGTTITLLYYYVTNIWMLFNVQSLAVFVPRAVSNLVMGGNTFVKWEDWNLVISLDLRLEDLFQQI
jgi:hypothetical protein